MTFDNQQRTTALVLDMQPIDPPVGGGRIRLLGLYHSLYGNSVVTYLGSYDWPGEGLRDQMVSPKLREICVPLSDSHFIESEKIRSAVKNKTVIDATFHQLGHLSEDFVSRCRKEIIISDIVIFSHPWVFPLVKDCLDLERQMVVYDSHNVEGLLRMQLLDDGEIGTQIVREVVRVEYELCHLADLVLSCSHDDRLLFNRFYGVDFRKLRILPNGVFTSKIFPVSRDRKQQIKNQLDFWDQTAVFIGSQYQPNIEAAEFICFELASLLPGVLFNICGGVCEGIDGAALKRKGVTNVRLSGFLSEEDKILYLQGSDFAVNPMQTGSGTNIKMFDFFAAGLVTLSTPIGARGIYQPPDESFIVCKKDAFASSLASLISDQEKCAELSTNARNLVCEKYAWERISPDLGKLLKRYQLQRRRIPFFSVVIPSYNRHDQLITLIQCLQNQSFRDFEVLIIDQSRDKWPERNEDFGFPLYYYHTDIVGAVKARNSGIFYSSGRVIAFTDDDCQPKKDWLKNAYLVFKDKRTVGVEGFISTEKRFDPDYRTVTNEGMEGVGFMTANLMVRSDIAQRLNGFDERFDNPHFREDTDFAWRALEYGKIPFLRSVEVFHPPHPRKIKRECLSTRNTFFEKDALLLKKHPKKFKELFFRECQWSHNPDYISIFRRGCRKYGVGIPEWTIDLQDC